MAPQNQEQLQSNTEMGTSGSQPNQLQDADSNDSNQARDSRSPDLIQKFPFSHLRGMATSPYVWAFLVLLAISGGVIWYAQSSSDSTDIDRNDFSTASINEEDFASLAADQAEIDSTNKTLNVQANSTFDGTMLVRSSLDVQGKLRVGEELTLNNVVVSGQATMNNLDIDQDLNVQGETRLGPTAVQNSLTVNENLTVSGSGTFAGTLTAQTIETGNLAFNGDLNMSGRIITGGTQTSAGTGSAIGSGGTVSVNGNDTAGNVRINTGGSPSSGTLVRVRFGSAYSRPPRVNITPVGSASGRLDWYVTRTQEGFAIGASSPPGGGNNYAFDYFVVE